MSTPPAASGEPVTTVAPGAPATADTTATVDVTVIVPVSERADDLRDIYALHAAALEEAGYSFEFQLVINGGWDAEAATATALAKEMPQVHATIFARNFGESAALAHGIRRAQGRVVCTVPAYFQVEPDELVRLIEAVDGGADLVVARRWPRTDPAINQLQTRMFAWLVDKTAQVNFRDVSCGVRAMRRDVAAGLQLYGDLHRFIPVLADREGYRVTEVNVRQSARDAGLRVYGGGIYLRRLLDLLTLVFLVRFTQKPLRFFGMIGAGLFGAGVLIDLWLTVQRLTGASALANRPMLLFGTLLIVLGVQIVSVGLLGEILVYVNARKNDDDDVIVCDS